MLRKKSIIYYLFIKKYIYNAHHSKHKLLERKGILLNGSSNILIGWICYFILYFWKSPPPPTNRGNWKKNNFNFWCSFNCKNWTTENRKIIKISTWWYIWNIYPVKQTLYTSNLYKSLSGNVSNLLLKPL